MKKLILHIPHSSIEIPFFDGYVSNQKTIKQEINRLTDWYTDDLFDSEFDEKIIAPFSRIFCDVERFSDDEFEVMAKFGMGVLYEKFDNGNNLRIVNPKLREDILNNYYWKHHDKFRDVVKRELEETEYCIILDCHSFPSSPLNRAIVQNPVTPDFNIGSDLFHTPTKFINASEEFFISRGYTLGINTPYSGSIVPLEYYKKDRRVNSIMLEVNRRMYLNESTYEKSENYQKTKEIILEYINLLKSL